MIEKIRETIKSTVPDAKIYVFDPQNDGQHFSAVVVSPSFEGMPLVRQHQAILNSLKNEFASNVVHALQLKTFTPAKWEVSKSNYPVTD